MEGKPFFELTIQDILDLDPALLEYQIQEGLPPGLVAKWVKETAAALFTARCDLHEATREGGEKERKREWWETFRAAVIGNAAGGRLTVEEVREFSARLASLMHGPLDKSATE